MGKTFKIYVIGSRSDSSLENIRILKKQIYKKKPKNTLSKFKGLNSLRLKSEKAQSSNKTQIVLLSPLF
jgi:hypothetical protein